MKYTHWKRPWCWEKLGARGGGDNRGWYGWMASPTQWTWVWVNSGRWWRTAKPGVLQSMGLQRVTHDLATEQQHDINNILLSQNSRASFFINLLQYSKLNYSIYYKIEFLYPLLLINTCWLLSCVQFFVNPEECSLPGSAVHGILQARILERVAISLYLYLIRRLKYGVS